MLPCVIYAAILIAFAQLGSCQNGFTPQNVPPTPVLQATVAKFCDFGMCMHPAMDKTGLHCHPNSCGPIGDGSCCMELPPQTEPTQTAPGTQPRAGTLFQNPQFNSGLSTGSMMTNPFGIQQGSMIPNQQNQQLGSIIPTQQQGLMMQPTQQHQQHHSMSVMMTNSQTESSRFPAGQLNNFQGGRPSSMFFRDVSTGKGDSSMKLGTDANDAGSTRVKRDFHILNAPEHVFKPHKFRSADSDYESQTDYSIPSYGQTSMTCICTPIQKYEKPVYTMEDFAQYSAPVEEHKDAEHEKVAVESHPMYYSANQGHAAGRSYSKPSYSVYSHGY